MRRLTLFSLLLKLLLASLCYSSTISTSRLSLFRGESRDTHDICCDFQNVIAYSFRSSSAQLKEASWRSKLLPLCYALLSAIVGTHSVMFAKSMCAA